jgi:multiple sugar transport system substrate-binding protein
MARLIARLALICLLVLGLLPSTGCGGGAQAKRTDDGRVILEFWHAMGSGHSAALNDICTAFNASQNKYFVRPIYQGRYNSLGQKLIASLYARRNPAMSQMYPGWTTRFYRYGYLEPLQNFIDNDPEFAAGLDDFFPVMLEENTLVNPKTGKSELVTLPFNKSVYVLYINETRMKALGFEEAPRTWAELTRLAEAMTTFEEGSNTPRTYGFATRPFIEDYTVFMMAAGLQLQDEATGELYMEEPEGVAVLEYLRSLVRTGMRDPRSVGYVENDFLNGPFGSEIVGMFVSSTAGLPYTERAVVNKFTWTVVPVPARDENTPARTLMQGTNVGIYANLSEEQKQGSWEFIKFLCSPEMNGKWAMRTGYMPIRRSTKELPDFKAYMERDTRYAKAVSTLEAATFEPRKMYWESVRSVISQEVEAVLFGRREAAVAMANAAREIRETMAVAE